MRDKEIVGALYGYQLLSLFAQLDKSRLYKTLFQSIRDTMKMAPPEAIPTVRVHSSLNDVLEEIVKRRFGDTLVLDEKGQPIGLLSLHELLQACEATAEKTGVRVGNVASPIKAVSEQTNFDDVIRFCFRNRTRRILIKKSNGYRHADERSLLKHFFSMRGLQSIRENAERYLGSPIASFVKESTSPLAEIRGTNDVSEAWKAALSSGQDCVVVDSGKIATPWDLVVKPFIHGNLNPRTLHSRSRLRLANGSSAGAFLSNPPK